MTAIIPNRRVVFVCEACGERLVKRTSYRMHRHLRHDVWRCDDDACGAIYIGNSELTSIATPSSDPNARPASLPLSKFYQRLLIRLAQKFASKKSTQLDMVFDQQRKETATLAAAEMRADNISEEIIESATGEGLDVIEGEAEDESNAEEGQLA